MEKIKYNEFITRIKDEKIAKVSFKEIDDLPEDFPTELYTFSHITELDLATISVSNINEEIKRMVSLKTLIIENGKFENFPLSLMDAPSLTNLTINNESLMEIPKVVERWHKLTYLNLARCKRLHAINGLPPNLNYINISFSGLSGLPKKINGLRSLTKLVAEGYGFNEIPNEIFSLKTLLALFLGNNNISQIPNKIWQLPKLVDLSLTSNNFDHFPQCITKLKSLKTLFLNGNNLSKLPDSIKDLSKLTKLELGSNLFNEFPKEVFNLKNLTKLSFGNYDFFSDKGHRNTFKILPSEIVESTTLKYLELFKTDIENVPKEILNEGLDAIKNFFKEKNESGKEEYLYEAKMVMVGRGNVGKTALTKKLTLPEYELTRTESTKGIEILKNPFQVNLKHSTDDDPVAFNFNIWDFGGQEKYDATHQLFITNRSIYLFLTEAREESNYLDFYYWLNTISLFSNNSPVIVVLSKFDERRKQIPESIYREKFKNILKFIDVSCATGYEQTIENLKEVIREAVLLLPQTKQQLPNTWIDIRTELQTLAQHKDYISDAEYLSLCSTHGLDKVRANFLSQYLNDLGVIIHHQNDLLLRKTVFINTDWCVDGLYKVLDDNLVFDNNGKFSTAHLTRIWDDPRFENKQAELIKLMHEYKLCFELRDGTGYIAPDLLPPDKPKDFAWDYSFNLQFEYKYDFMPSGLLSRLIVKCHGLILDNQFWKYGVVLKYEDTQALIEEDYIHNKIKISINGMNKKGMLQAIRMYIDEVHKDFDKSDKLIFEEMVPCNCPDCLKTGVPHFYKFAVLKRFETKSIENIPCDHSGEVVNVASLVNDIAISNLASRLETSADLKIFIEDIIDQTLKREISLKGGYINFWRDVKCTTPKNETEIQPYVASIIDHYCKSNGIQLSREVYEANGSVDILFSFTNKNKEILRVCLEIKKAHHQHVETAIATQLPTYMASALAESGIYLVFWFKNKDCPFPNEHHEISDLELLINDNNPNPKNIKSIILDVNKPVSPSKIKSQ